MEVQTLGQPLAESVWARLRSGAQGGVCTPAPSWIPPMSQKGLPLLSCLYRAETAA